MQLPPLCRGILGTRENRAKQLVEVLTKSVVRQKVTKERRQQYKCIWDPY